MRVLIGHAYGMVSPVKTLADTLWPWEAAPQAEVGQQSALPEAAERALYVVSGALEW
ncbi:MAG: hypothetical protein R3E95_18320 [Thiolinea sp.]